MPDGPSFCGQRRNSDNLPLVSQGGGQVKETKISRLTGGLGQGEKQPGHFENIGSVLLRLIPRRHLCGQIRFKRRPFVRAEPVKIGPQTASLIPADDRGRGIDNMIIGGLPDLKCAAQPGQNIIVFLRQQIVKVSDA